MASDQIKLLASVDSTVSMLTSDGFIINNNQNIKQIELQDIQSLWKADIQSAIQSAISTFTNSFFPIGTVIILDSATANPNTYLSGTWENIASGSFLVGVNSNDDDFSTTGKTGGEKEVTLTVSEMPSHNHEYNGVNTGAKVTAKFGAYPIRLYQDYAANWWGPGSTSGISSSGGGEAHNNLPPYYCVYYWKRVS